MKKEKIDSPIKAARKKTRDAIKTRLVKTLKTITSELGQEEVNIEKEAKKLAKKLTKGLKKNKEAESVTSVTEPQKITKENSDATSKTVAKPAVAVAKKPAIKATTPKAMTAKITTPKSVKK